MLAEIFLEVGNDLATLLQSINSILSFFLISCKSFNELTETKLVLQKIQLTPYFSHPTLQDDKAKKTDFFML